MSTKISLWPTQRGFFPTATHIFHRLHQLYISHPTRVPRIPHINDIVILAQTEFGKVEWDRRWEQSFPSLIINNPMEQSSLRFHIIQVSRDKQALLFYWFNTNTPCPSLVPPGRRPSQEEGIPVAITCISYQLLLRNLCRYSHEQAKTFPIVSASFAWQTQTRAKHQSVFPLLTWFSRARKSH